MKKKIAIDDYRVSEGAAFHLKDRPTALAKRLYANKKEYSSALEAFREEIDDLQNMMYAHDRYSLLLVFQAMDAAGKDGTIRHIMSGVNAHGVEVHAFKRPSSLELDHDFLWRTNLALPPRGKIGIFNRSYYEEVLICKVHPEIVTEIQHLPESLTRDLPALWQRRYESIRDLERHLVRNGTVIMKFFLNVSKAEQKRRFLARIDRPEKNWKFSQADVEERQFWDAYMEAYESAIRETASPEAPWYVVPADDKRTMRLIVGGLVLDRLESLNMSYPSLSPEQRDSLSRSREQLESERNGGPHGG